MKKKIQPILFAGLAFVICMAISFKITQRSEYISDMKELNSATDRLSAALSRAFTYADILELSIKFDNGNFTDEKFQELTDIAIKQNTCIDSLQLAPNAIVTYINPIEGNEGAIGHNLLEDENRIDYVLKAIALQSVVTQGPLNARQGGVLIFGRKAIMVNGEFWGLAVISVDFEELLRQCNMTDDLPFDFSIAVYDSNDNMTYSWGDENLMKSADGYSDLQLQQERWRISIKHKYTIWSVLSSCLMYIILSAIISIMIYIITAYYLLMINSVKTDHMTNALNRMEFQKQVEKRLRYNYKNKMYAMLAIDMDKFKYINDTYGHMAGNKVLIYTYSRIKKSIRGHGLVSRVNGDEYMVFLTHIINREQVISTIDNIREATEQEIPIGEYLVKPRLSIGYSVVPADGKNYKTLYKVANENMYSDKSQRRKDEN